jgi:hypothetical protein
MADAPDREESFPVGQQDGCRVALVNLFRSPGNDYLPGGIRRQVNDRETVAGCVCLHGVSPWIALRPGFARRQSEDCCQEHEAAGCRYHVPESPGAFFVMSQNHGEYYRCGRGGLHPGGVAGVFHALR